MTASSYAPSPELLAVLHEPLTTAEQRDTPDVFFARPELAALYAQAQDPEHTEAVLRACASLLPLLHPHRASLLALMGGVLVEDDADPTLLFAACLVLLDRWLAELEPFCASEVEDDDDEVAPEDRQAWEAARQRMADVPREERWQVETLHQALELLVLPMMTMVLRDTGNHAAFVADPTRLARLHKMSTNDSLPFEQLHYLWLAACMSYEDELVVVLPATQTGFVVRAHALNNTFHAFTLLQRLIREHADALRVTPPAVPQAGDEAGAIATATAAPADEQDHDTADFLWLQAHAYENGELKNEMAWAWGEAPLRENAARHGKRVLVALDKEGVRRSWSGFTGACHGAQNPHIEFLRYLSPADVRSYLGGA
ncbi:hypothetical protein ACILG0_11770 [Pseudomonadota bacterium AL_CKDN230030165-1A_HGKHYDSX7]